MKRQIIVIHGGDTFDSHEAYLRFLKNYPVNKDYFERYHSGAKDWKAALGGKLGTDFEVILPSMPCKNNAKYSEWKIWFEKFIPFFEAEVILVGHSLGGIFLAKYLSENDFPKKIKGLFLVSAPYDAKETGDSLADFLLPADLSRVTKQCPKIFLYHSKDDQVVPFREFEEYSKALPQAQAMALDGYGHFRGENFPEIINDIKNL